MNYVKKLYNYIKFISGTSVVLAIIIIVEKIIRLLLYPFKYFNKGKNIDFFVLGFDYCIDTPGGKFFIRKRTDDEFIISPFFEDDLTKEFNMKEGIFLDIGSHIGKYSIMVARQAHKNNVIAFEANSSTYKSVLINSLINNLDNITIENCAIGEKKGELTFLESKKDTGISRIVNDNGKKLIEEGVVSRHDILIKKVKVISIDEYLSHKQIDTTTIRLIKIDVEGNELQTLLGMKNLLSANKNIKLIVEITDSLQKIIEYMAGLSYTYNKISENYFIFKSQK